MPATRVLVIDDDPQITQLLRRLLKRTGRYEVHTENRGSAAVIAAMAFHPDVILLDVCMPDMDGPEVARELEAVPELRGIPVVFLTGLVSHQEIGPLGHEAGHRLYLPKTMRPADLIKRLEWAVA